MKPHGLNELREMFLSFFESKGHLRLPSFPLVPKNDASLLLINSGMAPMKTWFTGQENPPRARVCTCQKCIRTGDIENIGKTARHGTYFEMLGNFSFGDYFKKESLAWSWEFLTEVVGIDPKRLYPSVYLDDDQAFEIWNRDIGIPAERIFRFGKDDNFWEHGSGPCGPCSEIYFDRGEKYGCGSADCTVGCDCDRYIEVWNNVFSQFSSDGAGTYTELAQKNIDTGMGLERLACVCQDVPSLFDVDTVMRITAKVTALTGAAYGQSDKTDVSLRVITDHIRSSTMMICDGVLPSNEGRGYVLRRLLRRAARHGKLLGVNHPFLFEVCDTVVHENRGAYPDLAEKQGYITRVIRAEEENFAKTIDAGMSILAGLLDDCKASGQTVLPGGDAFKLYDTYGFPIDLTIELLEEQGFTVDRDGFDANMEEQRVRARTARLALGDLAWAGIDLGLDSTPTAFTGYDQDCGTGKILALVRDGAVVSDLGAGEEGIVVLDRTPFYAEMGGEVADHGQIRTAGGVFAVTDVQRAKDGKYLHHGAVQAGALSSGDTAEAETDAARRAAVRRAHTATHLLHHALRHVLGGHVEQAGSLVEPDRLRFDFTHYSAMTEIELAEVTRLVNAAILAGDAVCVEETTIAKAKERGAVALFGEKYGETVRVVQAGSSIELCGGLHLRSTAMAGSFRLLGEGSVASGVRRIEAIVGQAVLDEMAGQDRLMRETAALLKTSPAELRQKAEQLLSEARTLRKALEQYKARESKGDVDALLLSARAVGGLRVVTAAVGEVAPDHMRRMGDLLRDKSAAVVGVFAAVSEDKVTFLAVCGKEAVAAGVKAGDIIKQVTALCGGSGGGKPDSAMGGGKEPEKTEAALAAVPGIIEALMG